MSRQILINSDIREKRAAILVDNELDDILFERDTYDQIASNIYRGQVKDVLPGMQAAFVDIGVEKNAFLHISDASPLIKKKHRKKHDSPGIQHILQPGQEIMVQVIKEPIGSKGPKITAKVTVPGRYFVLLPYENKIGVSRRISENGERKRLRKIARNFSSSGQGLIVRTNAAGKMKKVMKRDYDYLIWLWGEINRRFEKMRAPARIYKAVELLKLVVRDYLSKKVNKVVVDDIDDYNQLIQLTEKLVPDMKNRIFHYSGEIPIFKNYGVEKELDRLLQRKVWLESGGYIIIDSTEALVSIDVNTGKFTGKKSQQMTVLKTNLEAAREIARQLKLRDMGGIIIIDFIDMFSREDQQKVLEELKKELANDRTKTAVLGLTRLGLVEMTRKKVRERFGKLLQKECPYCAGTGQVRSEATMAMKVIQQLREMVVNEDFEAILLELHPEVAAVIIGSGGEKLEILEDELNLEIYIRGNTEVHIEDINIVDKGSRKKLRRRALPVSPGERYTVTVEEMHYKSDRDAIARVEGYIIVISDAGHLVGEEVKVEIQDVEKTFARAEIL
ncbi:MAG: Rne/Rng family ribonuclease [Halanaerobiaceae bacterium]